jgi:hypothetical protein
MARVAAMVVVARVKARAANTSSVRADKASRAVVDQHRKIDEPRHHRSLVRGL